VASTADKILRLDAKDEDAIRFKLGQKHLCRCKASK